MFKHNVGGRLGLLLSISVLATACAVGEIGGVSGASRLGPDSEPVASGIPAALVCSGASADVSASNGWRSSDASLPASGSLYFEFKARPATGNLDGLVGVGAEDITDFTKAAIAVRFAADGLVDVRDGAFYSSDVSYDYDPGVWYNVAVYADVATETYDVAIGPCGEPRETLIKGASFRPDANVSDQLSTWAVWSSQAAALDVSTPTWMASGGCAPATCQSLGHECGQPSDGCGGTLSCGSCGSGESCLSGICVDAPANAAPLPPPVCAPATCESLGMGCGSWSNGCGGFLNCGTCNAGALCSAGSCIDVAPEAPLPPACMPATCQSLGAECGQRSDGCGAVLSCGSCSGGDACSNSVCVPPPPPACTPASCQSLGAECGQRSDGCGGTLDCGGCGSGESCSSGICVQDPGISPPSGGTNRPGAHNTGPSNPGVLKSLGSTTITTDGTVLEDFDMKGRLYIEANDVTVRNFRINSGTHYGIWVKPGYSNILIEDGEIYNATSALLYTQSPTTARRLDLHYAAADGMKIESNNTLIEYCFMEDIGVLALDPEAHADGNQTRGGSNVTFRYNNFDMPKGISGIDPNRIHMLHDTSDGKSNSDFSNFVVEHNWMNGGNYTVTCLPGVVYRDNFFGRDYNYGVRAGGGCAWTNNRWDDTGNLIP